LTDIPAVDPPYRRSARVSEVTCDLRDPLTLPLALSPYLFESDTS
jgi:hypothetical protein